MQLFWHGIFNHEQNERHMADDIFKCKSLHVDAGILDRISFFLRIQL